MASKKIEGHVETVEEQLVGVHGEMAAVKADLQRLGPLEVKVDSMLEKISILDRLEKMVLRWEDPKRITISKQKKENSVILGGSKSGTVPKTLEESSTGVGLGNISERRVDLSQKEIIHPDENEETTRVGNTEENSKVETLTRCLEMHVFEG